MMIMTCGNHHHQQHHLGKCRMLFNDNKTKPMMMFDGKVKKKKVKAELVACRVRGPLSITTSSSNNLQSLGMIFSSSSISSSLPSLY